MGGSGVGILPLHVQRTNIRSNPHQQQQGQQAVVLGEATPPETPRQETTGLLDNLIPPSGSSPSTVRHVFENFPVIEFPQWVGGLGHWSYV